MHTIAILALVAGTSHADDITRRKAGVGFSVAQTARQDSQGGLSVTYRAKDQLLLRAYAPLAGAAYTDAFGVGGDVTWRSGPELRHDDTQLFLRYGAGAVVGVGTSGTTTVVVTQGVAGAEVLLGWAPATLEFELRPQFLVAPYRGVDLAVATGVSWWF